VNKGNALLRLRRPGEAVTSFDDALELRPTLARALVNRAAALLELGRQAEALEDAQSALELQPADIDCRIMQARALLACRRPAEALAAIDAALSIDPHSANALVNRAAALIDLGLAEDALVACDGALALRADHVAALTNRAAALLQMGLGQEALACIESALRHDDSDTDALMAHALALASLRRHEEAISVAESAIYRNPESPRPWFHCAAVLLSARRPDAAVACFDAAREAGAPNAAALSDRAAALVLLGRHAEASESLGRALELDPEFPYARGARLEARLHVCDWQDYEEETARIRDAVRSGRRVASPFALAAIPSTAAEQAQCARTYAADVVRSGPAWPRASVSAHDRIRIAYLSADFRDHPVAHLIVDLIESHDRRDFETFGIALGAGCDDPMRQRLRGAFDHFIEADALSDQAIAHRLRELEIDIAVDLMGYTRECRPGILARRPVPVQVSYLGFPGTMGAPFIDYLIADRHVVPPAEHEHYDERIVYLPHCFMANHQRRPVADHAVSRASAGLPERGFVFCCLNASYKIAPPVFGAWMRLLRAVPGSVLWLSAKDAARENLRRHAATHGVDGQRLVFASRVSSYSEYLARYRLADLFLDTLPYNAHATATDALWAGLPLLTCTGGTFAGRVATSLLHAIGLPDLVTSSLSGYEALAFDLATDPARLRTLRERLAANRTTRPLFNGAGFRMSIESAYREMHRSHRSGQAPGSFAVH
jgi:predicted O-linked N-acetylglucosamine transferase (SPINDLY family)